MALFDRLYTTYYWSAIVSIALSCTIFELFGVEFEALKSRLGVTQGHWKWHHSKAWVRFISALHSNYAVTCIISEIK